MKTIDEAMGMVMTAAGSPEERDAQLNQMEAVIDSRRDFMSEIAQNPMVLTYVQQYVDSAGPLVNYSVAALALSCFVNGIMIGMEMERQELPSGPPAAGRGSNQKGKVDE